MGSASGRSKQLNTTGFTGRGPSWCLRFSGNAARVRCFSVGLLLAVLPPGNAAPSFADVGGVDGGQAVRTARGWAAMSGSDLKATLDGWSRAAGWTLVWDSPINYRLRASARFAGDFETAVSGLVDTIHRSNPELLVTLYRGNRVIYVETTLVETR
jgi:hypothetical protein